MKDSDPYQYGEGTTGGGQAVLFACPAGEGKADEVRKFLKENVRNIDIPITGCVQTPHGAYAEYTRYDIQQHRYAGGGNGYIEILEIKNPPDGRWGIIINEYHAFSGSTFTEWETIEDAQKSFEKCFGGFGSRPDSLEKLPGFRRHVVCGPLTPWFYAVGDERLINDYTFPKGIEDDPVFRFGKKFVVFDKDGTPDIKTCLGARFFEEERGFHPYGKYHYRLVYFDDGSVWDERIHNELPRPAEEGEMWIAEAVQQFKQMLVGKNTEFTINFTDSHKFVGKLMKNNRREFCAEGDYFLVVHIKGKKKPNEGWVKDFKPTPETPDIVQFVIQSLARNNKEAKSIEVKKKKTKRGGKKWAGVFFHPPR